MRANLAIFLGAAVLMATQSHGADQNRSRPLGVPPHAIWAGGPDGGNWLECLLVGEEPPRFRCISYWDSTGELKSIGEYRLTKLSADIELKDILGKYSYIKETYYRFFDGKVIHLSNGMSLWPDSAIIWPFSGGYSGKIVIVDDTGHSKELQYDPSNIND